MAALTVGSCAVEYQAVDIMCSPALSKCGTSDNVRYRGSLSGGEKAFTVREFAHGVVYSIPFCWNGAVEYWRCICTACDWSRDVADRDQAVMAGELHIESVEEPVGLWPAS